MVANERIKFRDLCLSGFDNFSPVEICFPNISVSSLSYSRVESLSSLRYEIILVTCTKYDTWQTEYYKLRLP